MDALRITHPTLWLVAEAMAWVFAALTVLLTLLANVTLPADLARANPRLASAIVFARKVAPVLRGAFKPLAGIFLPKYAAQVVEELLGTDVPSPPSGPENKP